MRGDGAADAIRACLSELGLPWAERDGAFTVTLPGERKLQTECALVLDAHALHVRAFVARHVDENHEAVYRWLLERNLKTYLVAFSVDHNGDIHLTGRISRDAVTPQQVDRILGAVAEAADGSFNTILELGFASSIRREWQWRLSRGEPTHNLAAFEHLRPPPGSMEAEVRDILGTAASDRVRLGTLLLAIAADASADGDGPEGELETSMPTDPHEPPDLSE